MGDAACQPRRGTHLLFAAIVGISCGRMSDVRDVDVVTLSRELESRPNLLVVDVREPADFEQGHLRGAINVPVAAVEDALAPALDSGRPVVTVCYRGRLSKLAAARAMAMGFSDVRSLTGGMEEWREARLPVVQGAAAAIEGGRPPANTPVQWARAVRAYGLAPWALLLLVPFAVWGLIRRARRGTR